MSRSLAFKLVGLLFLAGLLSTGALSLNTRATLILYADDAGPSVPSTEPRTLTTRAATVGAALREAGIPIYPEDIVRPPLDARLTPDMIVRIDRASLVRVEADGQTQLVRTHLTSVSAILGALSLGVGPGDEIWADDVLVADPARPFDSGVPRAIVIRRGQTVNVVDGRRTLSIQTAARTVGEVLWRSGYQLYLADEADPPLDAPVTPGMTISVHRSSPVLIQADGRWLQTRTRRTTVGAVLSDAGLALVGEDYAAPDADQPLPETGRITVVRVREEVLTEQQAIPFETVYQALPGVDIDTVYQVQAGRQGLTRRLTRVRYENGVEVSRLIEAEEVVQAPAPRVIGYGVQIVVRTLDTPEGPVEYWRAYTMYATSYAAKFLDRPLGSRNYGRTASGKILTKGLVAVDRTMMPFGTRMYIPDYGFAEAADTGGGVKGRWIDLGYDDWNYVSWHRVVTVYFLTPVPPAEQIRWIIPSTVP